MEGKITMTTILSLLFYFLFSRENGYLLCEELSSENAVIWSKQQSMETESLKDTNMNKMEINITPSTNIHAQISIWGIGNKFKMYIKWVKNK